MTTFTNKPNTGVLFHNKKQNDKSPDMVGDVYIDAAFIKRLIDLSPMDVVKLSIATWNKTAASTGKQYQVICLSEPKQKKENE